jgi:tetratricopeptide (TPR) repeat protein
VGAAAALYKEAVEGRRKELGHTHPSTLVSIHNYAACLADLGRLGEAAALYAEALAGQRAQHGPRAPSTLLSVHNLGLLMRHMGKQEEALRLFREAHEGRCAVLGKGAADTIASAGNYGEVLKALACSEVEGAAGMQPLPPTARERFVEAPGLLKECHEYYLARFGGGARETLQLAHALAVVQKWLGKHEEAGVLFKEALEGRRRLLGGTHEETLNTIH